MLTYDKQNLKLTGNLEPVRPSPLKSVHRVYLLLTSSKVRPRISKLNKWFLSFILSHCFLNLVKKQKSYNRKCVGSWYPKSSTCSSIDNSLASVSLIFQDFRHFCRKIHKDHYIFENDFINMFGLIHTHCNTSHLHRNVNNLGQSTGKLLLPFILI